MAIIEAPGSGPAPKSEKSAQLRAQIIEWRDRLLAGEDRERIAEEFVRHPTIQKYAWYAGQRAWLRDRCAVTIDEAASSARWQGWKELERRAPLTGSQGIGKKPEATIYQELVRGAGMAVAAHIEIGYRAYENDRRDHKAGAPTGTTRTEQRLAARLDGHPLRTMPVEVERIDAVRYDGDESDDEADRQRGEETAATFRTLLARAGIPRGEEMLEAYLHGQMVGRDATDFVAKLAAVASRPEDEPPEIDLEAGDTVGQQVSLFDEEEAPKKEEAVAVVVEEDEDDDDDALALAL